MDRGEAIALLTSGLLGHISIYAYNSPYIPYILNQFDMHSFGASV